MRELIVGALLVAIHSGDASAQRPVAVYLNNVRLEGGTLRGATLTGVDIRFDENGDLYITAKGYNITTSAAAAQAAARPTGAARRYFVVPAPQTRVGAAQWEIDLYVNQTFIHKFRSKDPDPMIEITRHLKAGPNTLHFQAKKEAGERISASPADVFELMIGDGDLNKGQLMLNKTGSYRRSAAELGAFNSEMTMEIPQ